jgi:hypothetical protein
MGTNIASLVGVKKKKFGKCQHAHTNPRMRLLTRAE